MLLFYFLGAHLSFAQGPAAPSGNAPASVTPKGNSKITGVVSDSAASKPVEFVSVALVNFSDNKVIDGAVGDERGNLK